VHRTLDSAEGVVTGMFDIHRSKLQFIEVHTHDASNETLLPNDQIYPIIDVYQSNLTSDPDYQTWYQANAVPLMSKIGALMGTPVISMDRIEKLFDCTTVHNCHGKPTPFDEETIDEVYHLLFDQQCSDFHVDCKGIYRMVHLEVFISFTYRVWPLFYWSNHVLGRR
jgi:hypothetical protein